MSSEKLICLVGPPRFSLIGTGVVVDTPVVAGTEAGVDTDMVLDTDTEVSTSGKTKNKQVQNRQFEVLAYCIKCSPEERKGFTGPILFQSVWPDSTVNENNIYTQLSALNKALNSPAGGLSALLDRLPSLRVDIVEFQNRANALLKTPTSETARAFMKEAVPLMKGVFLPIEWKQQWVIEWREQIDALYTKALQVADGLLSSENLEDRLEMFEKAKWYQIPEPEKGRLTPKYSILPKATEIWGRLQLEKGKQPLYASPKSLVLEEVESGKEKAHLPKDSSEQEKEEITPPDAPISLENLTGTAVTLLGIVALFPGQAWVKVDLIAKDFLNAVGMSCDWDEAVLETWGIQREYNREVEIVSEIGIGKNVEIAVLQNRSSREAYIEAFWQLHKDSREKVWKWLADYGGSEDSTLKLCFALCLKEFVRRCPEGVEMSVLRVWLESPHFPPSPQKDHRNALLALEAAYSDDALREKVYFVIRTWSETHKLPLLQAAALLCGRCLSKHHPKEGLKVLESLLEKEGSLVSFIGIALRGYLTGDATATFSVLDELSRWNNRMANKPPLRHEILRIFIMLMNDAPINHESSLLLIQASADERVYSLCEELFVNAILDSKYSEDAWCQFSYWLLYAEKRSQYMKVIKKIYFKDMNAERRLARYLKLYKEHYPISYKALVN